MGDTERASNESTQMLQSSTVKQNTASSQQLDLNHLSSSNCGKRVGIPPSHPNHIRQISPNSQMHNSGQPMSFQNAGQGSSHLRSLSQPLFRGGDSFPPLSPSPYHESFSSLSEQGSCKNAVSRSGFLGGNYGLYPAESLPPRKTHRRSVSDSAFGFSALLESSLSPSTFNGLVSSQRREIAGFNNLDPVKSESVCNGDVQKNAEGSGERKSEGEVIDELFSVYMNLDNVETMKSSDSIDKIGNSLSERGHRGDTSDNETEGSINEIGNENPTRGASEVVVKKEGMKRSATQDITPSSRHYRSISMDSFMENMDFGEDSLKLPPRPSKFTPSTSIDKNLNTFSLEFGSGEFSGEELKKIMANDKLAEMALADPKRVKRILANRQSAARSKERKMRYISELEHKVQTLQSEVTTLSAQVTQLQRDSVALTNQNNELRFRLQAMEQQAQLRNALNETLHGEVKTLKLTSQQLGLSSHSSKGIFQIKDPKHETAQSQMSN